MQLRNNYKKSNLTGKRMFCVASTSLRKILNVTETGDERPTVHRHTQTIWSENFDKCSTVTIRGGQVDFAAQTEMRKQFGTVMMRSLMQLKRNRRRINGTQESPCDNAMRTNRR